MIELLRPGSYLHTAELRDETVSLVKRLISSVSPSPVSFEFTERSLLHKSAVNVSFQHEESPVHTVRSNNNLSTERHSEKLVDGESFHRNY